MPAHTFAFDYSTIAQRLALEQTLAYLAPLNQVAVPAAPGTVLDTCERVALDQGRDALRASFAAALQSRADAVEDAKKSARQPTPRARTPAGS